MISRKEISRRWRIANRKKASAATRRWQQLNPEKVLEGQRRRRAANREKYNSLARQWREANPEKARETDLKRFGLTLEQFDTINDSQQGLCAICGGKPTSKHKRLSVDHDHATGKMRGLLCAHCNHLLGHAKDNPEILKKAIAYLASTC